MRGDSLMDTSIGRVTLESGKRIRQGIWGLDRLSLLLNRMVTELEKKERES